jgi:Right handed beta helix region
MRQSATVRIVCGLLLASIASLAASPRGQVAYAGGPWYVSPAGNNNNDCLSPTTTCLTIGGAIGKASSGDTINIAAGVYQEDVLIIGKNLRLVGVSAATTAIEGGIGTSAEVQVSAITIRNGGGIFVDTAGVVTLADVIISGNRRGPGAGIYNDGVVIATNTIIRGNIASNVGGGMWNRSGARATLTNVTISDNKAQNTGGGILNTGTLTLTDIIFSSNTVTDTTNSSDTGGGAIFNDGDLRFTRGLVANNRAGGHGGGIVNVNIATLRDITVSGNQAGFSAGIENYVLGITATLTMTNLTISGNAALSGPGGGLLNINSAANLTNVTISGNTAGQGAALYNAGPLRLKNSIVSGSCDVSGQAIASLGHNLDSGASCGLAGPGDLKNANPKLGPLQDNGGFAPTHALLAGSPAIDKGDNAGCPAADQRGVVRPNDGDGNGSKFCDIGAYEFGPGFVVYLPLIGK